MNTPLIRIEVESMQSAMTHAFSQQVVQMDEMFKIALEDATNPVKLQNILTNEANKVIKQAIESEIQSYFTYGEGRELVKKEVIKKLTQENNA